MQNDDSQEQIASNIYKDIGINISLETIYNLVVKDKSVGGNLFKHLKINGKRKRSKRVGVPKNLGQIKHKVSIEKRLIVVDSRSVLVTGKLIS